MLSCPFYGGAAEAEALRRCNAEAAPFNDDPCVLYAVGSRVVLPQRRTEPLTPAGPAR